MNQVEYSLSVGSGFHFILTCTTGKDPITEITKRKVPYLFTNYDIIPIYALPINLISITTTFVWNFLDVFIMVISLGLSTEFQLFNTELKEAHEVQF